MGTHLAGACPLTARTNFDITTQPIQVQRAQLAAVLRRGRAWVLRRGRYPAGMRRAVGAYCDRVAGYPRTCPGWGWVCAYNVASQPRYIG